MAHVRDREEQPLAEVHVLRDVDHDAADRGPEALMSVPFVPSRVTYRWTATAESSGAPRV